MTCSALEKGALIQETFTSKAVQFIYYKYTQMKYRSEAIPSTTEGLESL